MIVTPKDVAALCEALHRHAISTKWTVFLHREIKNSRGDLVREVGMDAILAKLSPEELDAFMHPERATEQSILPYLRDNLHLFIPCGFDEVRVDPAMLAPWTAAMNNAFHRQFPDAPTPNWFEGARGAPLELMFGLRCRDMRSGVWYSEVRFDNDTQTISLRALNGNTRLITLEDILDQCKRSLAAPGHPAVMLLPNLWQPPELHPSIELADTTRALLLALRNQETDFSRLTWQQLEDIVAELLRGRGLQVQVTPRSGDGGRDILARGELIPGEPTVLAVEVKHKGVVCIDEIRSHLYANRQFPTLLFATSGRFSAGVVREKMMPETFLRLMLKDGQALGDWIRAYKPW